MRYAVRWIITLAFVTGLMAVLFCGTLAQDFYGEGNVLIAVDIGSFSGK